jgi:serine/threonine protein kinase
LTHEVETLWYRAPEILLGAKIYGSGVDMWSVGAIFFEIAHKRPLFQGDSEIGQLFKIFELLGTPDVSTWQGLHDLPQMKMSFPSWRGDEKLSKFCTDFDECAFDLLTKFIQMEPSKRISAQAALRHPYFQLP